MYLLFAVLTICTVLITVGLFYRVAMTIFFLGWSYIFLLEEARYLNHFYFVGLLAFLMIFVPAARGWSLDALIAGRSQDARIPAWSLWILRAQMEIMLIYAGIVKLTPDWLQGEPLSLWLANKADLPIIGPFLLNDTVIVIGAWGAALLHLFGAVMLLFKSTRLYAFVAYCLFHFANSIFFPIGIFPWLTIAGTLLFFDPDWPKVIWRNVFPNCCACPPGCGRRCQSMRRSSLGLFRRLQCARPSCRCSWSGLPSKPCCRSGTGCIRDRPAGMSRGAFLPGR